jgi:NADPH:quinone reductase-like Zn-dependent oxidoreductase
MVEAGNILTNNLVKCVDGNFKLVIETVPIKPAAGKLLVRTAYSTINPYDRILYREVKAEGSILGCDGCGVVIKVGEDVDEATFKGKKVAFIGSGWSQYAEVDSKFTVLLDDGLDLR